MTLQEHGVQIEATIDARGVLAINLVTERDVRVTVNGVPPKADAGPRIKPLYWQPDGKQTETPPVDLRGG